MTAKEFLALPFSAAIRQAVQDVKACTSAGIIINMDSWIYSEGNMVCGVCLAGACLLMRHEANVNFQVKTDENTTDTVEAQLGVSKDDIERIKYAFDELRSGHINAAFGCWYPDKDLPDEVDVYVYGYSCTLSRAEVFYLTTELSSTADELEKLGY